MPTTTFSQTFSSTSLGKHFYQFYRGREDLFRVAIPFLKLGLESQEACLWVVSNSVGIAEAIAVFQRRFDLSPFLERKQLLIIPAERWYLDRGRFSERAALKRMKKFLEERRLKGFSAFRGVSDVGWLEARDWPKFQAFERKIHDWMQVLKMTAICAYPIQHCSLTQSQDVLNHHHSVFQTKI